MPKLKKTYPVHDTITGYDFTVDQPLSRAKAIRAKCLECQGGSAGDVRNCHITDCALWPWRTGRLSSQKTPRNVGVVEQTPAKRTKTALAIA